MKLLIYTDGGSRGNPGPAATGVVILDEHGSLVTEFGEYLGVQTNNVAEYQAMIQGLQEAKKRGATSVACYADSRLVIEQLKGNWKVKHPNIAPLFFKAWNLLQSFSSVTLSAIPREKNTRADAQVNIVLDSKRI